MFDYNWNWKLRIKFYQRKAYLKLIKDNYFLYPFDRLKFSLRKETPSFSIAYVAETIDVSFPLRKNKLFQEFPGY